MKMSECGIIQELLPLYAEKLVSQETAAFIEEHLAGCKACALDWACFRQPLPEVLPLKNDTALRRGENRLFSRLKKTAAATLLLVAISGAGLAYASYTAGKHVGLDDPSYRFAQELGLFTEIKQSKSFGGNEIKLEKGLFDSTRSVLFVYFSFPVADAPWLEARDESGIQYEQKGSKGWQNKYFMFEFEPLKMDAQNLHVTLALGSDGVEFSFPVDPVKTAQYTTLIYPNQEKQYSGLSIAWEKAVLGVSESECRVRLDWPTDSSVAGIGFEKGTAYFPTSVRTAPDTPPPPGLGAPPPGGLMPGYAASFGVNYSPEAPPENRPALYDLTNKQEVRAEGGEYRTTQFPCQVEAILKFAPVKQETRQLELLLPPLYLYESVSKPIQLQLNFSEKNELTLEKKVSLPQADLILEKAWREKNQVFLSYHWQTPQLSETLLPHFELTDVQGAKQGQMRFDREKPRVIVFNLFAEEAGEFELSLDSIGHLLPREKFTLELQEE